MEREIADERVKQARQELMRQYSQGTDVLEHPRICGDDEGRLLRGSGKSLITSTGLFEPTRRDRRMTPNGLQGTSPKRSASKGKHTPRTPTNCACQSCDSMIALQEENARLASALKHSQSSLEGARAAAAQHKSDASCLRKSVRRLERLLESREAELDSLQLELEQLNIIQGARERYRATTRELLREMDGSL